MVRTSFVNVLGCPFNTGEIIYILLLVATVIWAIYETYVGRNLRRQNIAFVLSVGMLGIPFYGYGWSAAVIGAVVLAVLYYVLGRTRKVEKKLVPYVTARAKNTVLLCLLMLMIGYSSYAVIVIRSSANPPMDQNSPEDIFTLGSYLSRDQYGDSPLLYGQAYTSKFEYDIKGGMCEVRTKEGAPIWQRKERWTVRRRTPTSWWLTRTSSYMRRTCCSRVCTVRTMRRRMRAGWAAWTVRKCLTTCAENRLR